MMGRTWSTWVGLVGLAADAAKTVVLGPLVRLLKVVDDAEDVWADEVPDQPAGRPPVEQWWCINGEEILGALRRARSGDDPELVYLELYANSDSTDYGKENNQ